MNDKPKSIWKKSWKGPYLLLVWPILMAATMVIFSIGILIIGKPFTEPEVCQVLISGIVCVSFLLGLTLFFQWLCCWRNFKRFLYVLACSIVMIALFYAAEDWRGWHAWQKFKHEWEAKGERFDAASVVPPPVPENQNFALTPIVFTSYGSMLTRDGKSIPDDQRDRHFVDRLQMSAVHDYDWPTNGTGNWQKSTVSDLNVWQQYYRALAAMTNEFPVPAQPQSPADDVLLALSKYDSVLEELRQAGQLPYSRFPLDYDSVPGNMLIPHLADLKGCSQVLRLRAIAELHDGQSGKALDDVKLMLRLAEAIRIEPILISHLVRISIVNLAMQPVWEGLAEHKWSDTQLVELDRELARPDFLSDYRLAMRGEMVLCQEGIIDYMRRHRGQMSNMSEDNDDTTQSGPTVSINDLIPSGWFYQNQLRSCRFTVQSYLPLADLEHRIVPPASLRHADAALDQEFKHESPYNRLEAIVLSAVGGAVKKFAHSQTSVDLARVACALERYRLAHGTYPESLDALVPQFIVKLPHDIINGQPLHYRRTDNGQFVLYSVGWNETDDGGTVGLRKDGTVDINTGDWVWRYPSQ